MAALTAAATIGASVAGGLVAGPALAYPPDTAMSVSASPAGSTHHGKRFIVTVANGKPGCQVNITAAGKSAKAIIGADGTVSVPITIEADKHRRTVTVTAKTKRCKGSRETATTEVKITPGHVFCGGHGKRGRRFDVDLEDWHPRRRVSVIVTDGHRRIDLSNWADDRGHVRVHFTPDRRGTWAIIVVQDGQSSHVTIEVD